MAIFALCVVMQMCFAFAVAGLIWPDKFMSVYVLLMFPWPASYRAIRTNSIVIIGGYLLFMGKVLLVGF